MFDFIDLKTVLIILHVIGVAIGAGGAFMSDILFLKSVRDKKISKDEMSFISTGGIFVFTGLFLLILSGAGIFFLDIQKYIDSTKFLAKMTIVGIITINGFILHKHHLPWLKENDEKELHLHKKFPHKRKTMLVSGAISGVSWVSTIILGILKSIPFSYLTIMTIYLIIILISISTAILLQNFLIPSKKEG